RTTIVILEPGVDHDFGAGGIRLGGRHEGAPVPHVQRIHQGQPEVAVDPAAGVPAGVRLLRVVDPHGHHVYTGHQLTGDVVGKAAVAAGPPPEGDAVDPDAVVHVDAVEPQPGALTTGACGQAKRLAVPADTSREVA